jgi:hypothetical protein
VLAFTLCNNQGRAWNVASRDLAKFGASEIQFVAAYLRVDPTLIALFHYITSKERVDSEAARDQGHSARHCRPNGPRCKTGHSACERWGLWLWNGYRGAPNVTREMGSSRSSLQLATKESRRAAWVPPEIERLRREHTRERVRERLRGSRSASYLRDFVYGAVDGAVTTFAAVAGVAGAGLDSEVVIVLGIANLIADGFSMR